MNPINFNEYRERIIQALVDRGFSIFNNTTNTGDFILIDQFVNQSISPQLSGNVVIGGPTLPMIMIVGARTGEIKFFALKALVQTTAQ